MKKVQRIERDNSRLKKARQRPKETGTEVERDRESGGNQEGL